MGKRAQCKRTWSPQLVGPVQLAERRTRSQRPSRAPQYAVNFVRGGYRKELRGGSGLLDPKIVLYRMARSINHRKDEKIWLAILIVP
jgi:hypothetical protein